MRMSNLAEELDRATAEAASTRSPRAGGIDSWTVVTGCTVAVALLGRLVGQWGAPLWIDETFTGAIATQPNLPALVHWCLNELSGPVYYGLIWAWEKLAGSSDLGLRLPSLACSLAAPLILYRSGHPDRRLCQIWALLVALWVPGFVFASSARPYALLLLLSCGQAIAFLRMMERPQALSALAWTSLSALCVLTHYHAAIISGLQGIAFLLLRPRAAVRCWPALLPLVPMAFWMRLHLPLVIAYASPANVWYATLPPLALVELPNLLFGWELPGALLLLAMGATGVMGALRRSGTGAASTTNDSAWALVASGAIAFSLVFGAAFFRPSFTPRYLLPYMPAILFGVALWARKLERWAPRAPLMLVAVFCGLDAGTLIDRIEHPTADPRYGLEFERPLDWIMGEGSRRLVFLWDNPTADASHAEQLADMMGFFPRRAGVPMGIVITRPKPESDPDDLLVQLAREQPASAILWAFDRNVPHSRGIRFPPRIEAIDRTMRCRNFAGGAVTVLACVPRA